MNKPTTYPLGFDDVDVTHEVEKIEKAAIQQPYDLVRMVGSARVLKDNGNVEKARVILNLSVEVFPDSYAAWQELSKFPDTPDAQMKEIKAELLRLDPRTPVTP